MSYGFEIKNSNGAVLADAERPVFALSSTQTLGGIFLLNSSTFGAIYRFTIPPNDELIFFRIPTENKFFGRGPLNLTGVHGWWGNSPSVEIRRAKKVTDLGVSAPSGYGIIAKDSAGQITFRADASTYVISDALSVPFDTSTTIACDKEWFCIPNAWSGIVEVEGSTLYYRGTGVLRASLTQIRSVEGPSPSVTPPPFICLAAP